jgi:hypothetical protein
VDFSISKRFPLSKSKNIEFRAGLFNLLNHVNFANPISNLNAVQSSGGSMTEPAKGFARLYSPASRIVQPIRHDQPVARVLVEQLIRLDM